MHSEANNQQARTRVEVLEGEKLCLFCCFLKRNVHSAFARGEDTTRTFPRLDSGLRLLLCALWMIICVVAKVIAVSATQETKSVFATD